MSATRSLFQITDDQMEMKELISAYDKFIIHIVAASEKHNIKDISEAPNKLLDYETEEKIMLISKLQAIGHEVLYPDVIELWSLRGLYKVLLNEYMSPKDNNTTVLKPKNI